MLDLKPFDGPYDTEHVEKQYKRQAISFHPDKMGEEPTEDDKKIWLCIQKAKETILDQAKRRRYDSTLDFDDDIPEEDDIKSDDDFYKIFGEVFVRNSRFAIDLPAPEIGDKDTPIKDVHKFYSYWDNFKTWREFSQYHEHNPTEANDRFEKRWMEQENKKVSEKYRKIERKRLIKLAETAYKLDPRI